MIDEVQVNEGVYDEIYVDLNTDITPINERPTDWKMTTIMDAKFEGDLDAGSVGADGFRITGILLYRSVIGTNKWEAIAHFDYDDEYNVYEYADRYTQNGTEYEYALVPIANEVIGDKLISSPIKSEYEGIFITDKSQNRKLEYDISLGAVSYNKNSSTSLPLNSRYPIVIFGNSNYRSGSMSVLPLSKNTVKLAGGGIDKLAEQVNRDEWVDFLNNGMAKVIRMDSGVLMMVIASNVVVTHKENDALRDLANISFDFTEIGELNYQTMVNNSLISSVYAEKTTYDDYGGVISG